MTGGRRRRPRRGRSAAPRTSQTTLPTVRISFTPGAALATKSKRAGQRAEAGHQRDLELEAQVLLQRLLGVHRHGEEVGLDLAGLEGGGPGLEEVGQVALGVDLADQGALALLRGQQGERRRDGRLADTALAGDEDQLAVEQIDGRGRRIRSGAEADPAAVLGAADLDVGHLVDRHADLPAPPVGQPEGTGARQRGVDLRLDLVGVGRRRRARPRAPWGCRSRRCERPRILLCECGDRLGAPVP